MFYHNKGYLAYSTSFCVICTSQVLKQVINKTFYLFDKIKVPLPLDNTSPRCTYPAKDAIENAMLQKSTLLNVKCKFKFNILTYLQKSDLLIYFEKRRRVLHKGMRDRSLPLFSFQFHIPFNLVFLSTFFAESLKIALSKNESSLNIFFSNHNGSSNC